MTTQERTMFWMWLRWLCLDDAVEYYRQSLRILGVPLRRARRSWPCNEKKRAEWEQEEKASIDKVKWLPAVGHTHACAFRQTFGDGVCVCGKIHNN